MTTSGDILLIITHGVLLTSSEERPEMLLNTPDVGDSSPQ